MIVDQEARLFALFFFFALLDETKALQFASLAADDFEQSLARNPLMGRHETLVRSCLKVWKVGEASRLRWRPHVTFESGFNLPHGIDLQAWSQHVKTSSSDELLPLIWVHILGFHPAVVASGMELPIGTVRRRLSLSARRLGSIARTKNLGTASRPLRSV